jgi:uncharacterized protein YeaO (DUF488 family)
MWFGHDPAKWEVFGQRYRAELDANPGAWASLRDAGVEGTITLLYSSRDTQHNNAVILQAYLSGHLNS